MALESSELFGKMFQMALGQHIVRCPALLKYLDQSHISHDEFDFGFIRAVVLASKNVLGVMRLVPDGGIPVQLLMQQLGNMVRAGGIKPEEQDAVVNYVSNIYSQPIHPDYYIPMFQKFLEHQNIIKAMKEVSIHEPDKIASTIQRALDKSRVSSRRPIKPLVEHMMFERIIPVPCGLDTIDGPMMGGLGLKEYGILCAYTGIGKTTAAINFGWGAARQGFKSCLATLELTGEKVTQRLYSLVARYSYEKIRQPEAFPDQSVHEIIEEYSARYREYSQGIGHNFQIWDFAGERCSIQLLTDWLHREQDEDPEHPPQELLIDWLLCLDEDPGFNPRSMTSNEVRHKLQRYGDSLSRLAINENIAIWATHQADTKAEGKDKISMAHSAEGKSAGWKCSTFLGIGASEENRKENLFTVNASKMRDGRLFSAQIYGALDQQRFEDRQVQPAADPVDNRLSMAEDMSRAQRTVVSQSALLPT